MPSNAGESASIKRLLGWVLVVALSLAAVTAIGAILDGDLSGDDARVIGTSLGFAVSSATAASGAALRYRPSPGLRALGAITVGLSMLAFGLFLLALWTDDPFETPDYWRAFGTVGLAALACSHACVVSGGGGPRTACS